MNYYVVIDTNVLVSAMLKWNSVPGNVVGLAFDGPVIPVFNTQILSEYREVLILWIQNCRILRTGCFMR